MVTTNDAELGDRVALLRNHGYRPKYYNKVIGGNFRLDALQAAVLRVKLKYLDSWTEGRQRNAATYRRLFEQAGLTAPDRVVLPVALEHNRHIYNQHVIRVPRRDDLVQFLKKQEVGCEIYYPVPLHLQECFDYLGYQPGAFPESEGAAAQTLALPIYPELREDQLNAVVDAIRVFPGRS